MQKGRCRSCGAALSWQYPLVELGTGISFGLVAWLYQVKLFPAQNLSWHSPDEFTLLAISHLLFAFIALSAAIVILVSDMRFQTIPDGAVLVLFIAGAIVNLGSVLPFLPSFSSPIHASYAPYLSWKEVLVYNIGGALFLSFFFFSLWFFSQGRWMGFGDVKLIFATSLLLGFPASIIAFLFSFWSGGIFGILLLAANRENLGRLIPFGPFILLGTLLAYLFTDTFLSFTRLSFFFY